MIPRLKEEYNKKIIGDLQRKFSLKNKYMVPKFIKVVLNMGLGLDANDKKKLQNCIVDVSLISGQKPIVTKFKKSISNFKTRRGTAAGVKVTLTPATVSFRVLKFDIDFLNFVTMAF